jgi:hypothetical protein
MTTSESPKWIALVLSIVAITISGLSWRESRRSRLGNEAVNRPILTIGGARLEIDQLNNRFPDQYPLDGAIVAKLENRGKTTAVLTVARVDPNDLHRVCEFKYLNLVTTPLGEESFPGIEQSLYIPGTFEAPCTGIFSLPVTLTYTDVGTGIEYSQTLSLTLEITPQNLPPLRQRKPNKEE